MKKSLCLIFVLLVASIFKCAAKDSDNFKPGYIITKANDSIPGFILIRDHSFNSLNCVFKSTADGTAKTYTPLDLIAYGAGREVYYYAHQFDLEGTPKTVFLECIVGGKKGLFFYQFRYFLKTPTKIEELVSQSKTTTKDGKDFVVKLALYKSTLNQEMSDCSSINESLQQTSLDEKSLKKLFIKYYECIGVTPVVFQNESAKGNVSFGFSAGAAFSQLNLASLNAGQPYFDAMDASTNTGFVPSLWLTLSSSRNSLQLRTGLTYYTANYRGYLNNTIAGYTYEYTVSCGRLEIPLHLKYHLLRNNKAFYLVGGLGLNRMIKWDDKFTVSSSTSTTPTVSHFNHASLIFNLLGGLGYEIPFNKNGLFIEASYSLAPGVIEDNYTFPKGSITSINISAGILF